MEVPMQLMSKSAVDVLVIVLKFCRTIILLSILRLPEK